MQITPISNGSGIPGNSNIQTPGRSSSPERIAAAKAIMTGQQPVQAQTNIDPQVSHAEAAMLRLKRKTNYTPEANYMAEQAPQSAISDAVEQDSTVTEEPKQPLSPQFAALARQKRSIQVKEMEIAKREEALKAQESSGGNQQAILAQLKANPLEILQRAGVTYDDLTNAILASQSGVTPEVVALKKELEDLKNGLETKFTERDQQQEQQVLAQMRQEADQLVATGDDYELIREMGYTPKVIELIHRLWKEQGVVMDVAEAAKHIEKELLDDSLKQARIKKVQSQLAPQTIPQQQQTGRPPMRTLTNRDGAVAQMTAKQRAIAAFNGTLK